MNTPSSTQTIYVAGGCFWGIEHLMQKLPGVSSTQTGYAGGHCDTPPDYRLVCTGKTGCREAVRVDYHPDQISLDAILFAFFRVIDPEAVNRQGNDRGTQYQSGIYWCDTQSEAIVRRIAATEKRRFPGFAVELAPLEHFYPAEEEHQNYLVKNPQGYCHIAPGRIEVLAKMVVDPGNYPLENPEKLKEQLTPEQYAVTRESATEPPFKNAYWNNHQKGLYVDVITGEPLFTSSDKYDSSCGWPSFTAPIDAGATINRVDKSHGMHRTEVRSRVSDAHLGHVFEGDPDSPNGVRYCMNSAALRFIPLEAMATEGYEAFLPLIK